MVFVFKQKTAYEMRISDWSSDVCSSDLQTEWTFPELVADTLSMERPVLPAPHQVVAELNRTVLQVNITSRRSLVYHAWVTLESALVGFLFGTALGIGLAVALVHEIGRASCRERVCQSV